MKSKDFKPKLSDLKDTGGDAEGADLVLALMYPYRFPTLEEFMGYRIRDTEDGVGLGKRIRFGFVLKNRYGESDVGIAFGFHGPSRSFIELPKADKMTDQMYNQIIKM